MKKSTFPTVLALILLSFGAIAQDTVKVQVLGKNLVTVVEDGKKTDVNIGQKSIAVHDSGKDTVKVKVGKKIFVITESKHGSSVNIDNTTDKDALAADRKAKKFEGHWSALEMGINTFSNPDYKGYSTKNFLDLNQSKSWEINLNVLKYSIPLQKVKNNIGVVTGLGLNFNDYKFSNSFTIKNLNSRIEPIPLTGDNLSLTKLSTSFLTVPLLMEFQVPSESGRFFFSFGVIGGLKLGSHTKVKMGGDKTKDRSELNINSFRGGSTVRIGYKGFNIFGTYYFTPFFKDGRGPVMDPITVGIGILNW